MTCDSHMGETKFKMVENQLSSCRKWLPLYRGVRQFSDSCRWGVILGRFGELKEEGKEASRTLEVFEKRPESLKEPVAAIGNITSFVLDVFVDGVAESNGEEGDPQCDRSTHLLRDIFRRGGLAKGKFTAGYSEFASSQF